MNILFQGIGKRTRTTGIITSRRQRYLASSLLLLFAISLVAPLASSVVYAEQHPENPSALPVSKEYPPVHQTPGQAIDPKSQQSATASGGMIGEPLMPSSEIRFDEGELLDKRTADTTITRNADGSVTKKQFLTPQYFKQDGEWQPINSNLVEDKNAADSGNVFGQAWGQVGSWFSSTKTYKVEANDWQTKFAPSNADVGMVRLQYEGQTVAFRPVDAANVVPHISTDEYGKQTVSYDNLWPGIDVRYQVTNSSLKEFVVLKDAQAQASYAFAMEGASLEADRDNPKNYRLKGALEESFSVSALSVNVMKRGIISEPVVEQTFKDNQLTVVIDQEWLQSLPQENFPVVIDPTFSKDFGWGTTSNHQSFRSDGFSCTASVCPPNAGSADDNGWKHWRTTFQIPYTDLQGKTLIHANLHLAQLPNNGTYHGSYTDEAFIAAHASDDCFDCVDTGAPTSNWAIFNTVGDMDVTAIYAHLIYHNHWVGRLMLVGDEGPWESLKMFNQDASYVTFTIKPAAPSIASPTANQVFTDPQVSFKVNPIANDTPLQYAFRVSSGPGGTGTVIASSMSTATQWTVPDGVLQDGGTYYVQAQAYEPNAGGYSDWGSNVAFKVDTRTGKDSTQTFDTLGPVGVDLATGNVVANAASHTSAALGGSLGVSLDYNSPVRSRTGLNATYYNNTSFSGSPVMSRIDPNIEFVWDTGSPASGTVTSDNFSAKWQGYFVAPETASYQFGGVNDDSMTVKINGNVEYTSTGCWPNPCYGGSSVSLTVGQVVPIEITYVELLGGAQAHLKIKRNGGIEVTAPTAWLQTGVRPVTQQRGLTGHYYKDDGSHNFTSGNNVLFMQRIDPLLSFDWGTGSPFAGGSTDNFLVRWTGYVTVPTSGNYQFGTLSDDGSRVKMGSSETLVYENWADHLPALGYNQTFALTAGVPTPITVEYYENGGGASFALMVKGAVPEQIVPATWLSPKAQPLPEGWSLGVDPDGNLGYDRLRVTQTSAILTDSSGGAHEYTYANGAYKPPVNEYGQLVRNADGSFTLQDVDGRTYVFKPSGELSSVTSPVDDRKPSALQYEYTGSPAKIQHIRDGVDPSGRWARVYYSGESECGSAPPTFDSAAPAGMMCAVQTNDGRFSYFYYSNQRLARIALPGQVLTDFQYDSYGRLTGVRDALANDAILAGVRTNDASVLSEIFYDDLGRATSVKQPAATSGAARLEHTVEYLPGTTNYAAGNPAIGYLGATQQHVVGATEPHGFSRRIEYDHLLRTTRNVDIANLATSTEWDATKDLLLSTSDATGLKATTIYDDEDRVVHSYGPAPASWFGADRKPTSGYLAQAPHTETKYDESITGPSVSWYNAKNASLFGAPKLHTTGLTPSNPGLMNPNFAAAPIVHEIGMDGIGASATGVIRFPGTGVYTFQLVHDDSVALWIDDQLVIGGWGNWSDTIRTDSGTFTATAGKPYRFRLDYATGGTHIGYDAWLKGPGISEVNPGYGIHDWGIYVKPGYNLPTSTKVSDSTIGDTLTTTNYGSNPELGLAQSGTVDPAGLNLTTTNAYETQGATGSFLRQTGKTLPGGGTTAYGHYTATETRDNPCTPATEAYKQAGFIKTKTEADPDGAGSQTSRVAETIYDDTGRTVASRYNADDWTCTTYDTRGRVSQTTVPTINGRPGRTLTTTYSYQSSPFKVQTVDSVAGTAVSEIDLLGRTVSGTDTFGNTSTATYDNLGRLSSKTTPVGTETYTYDNYNRITEYLLGGTKYATLTYDAYSRVQDVTYNQAEGQGEQAGPTPVVQSSTSGSVSTGALTLNKPTGTANGDLLVMTASADLSAAEDVTYTIPSGWTQLLANTRSDVAGAGNNLQVWYKIANNEPASYAITPDHSNLIAGSVVRIDGHDASGPIDVSNVTASATGEASAPSVTTTVNNAQVLRFATWDQSKTMNSIPSGHTQSYHVDVSGHDNWGGYKEQATAGSTGTAQFDLSSGAPYVGFTVAIKPAGSGGSSSNNTLKLEQIKRDALQRNAGAVFRFSDDTAFDETVTRTQGGMVGGYTDVFGGNTVANTYTYDKAGRLLEAVIDKNKYTYGYSAPSGSTCNQTSANLNSHKNSNRTSYTLTNTVNSQVLATSTYCYDQADRLLTSSDAQLGTPTYDDHGNTITLAGNGTPITFTYDASDSNTAIEQGTNKVTYLKTASGGVLRKKEYTSGTLAKSYRYLAGGAVMQSCSLTNENDCTTTDTYLNLPGGVTLTLSPTNPDTTKRTIYSIKNFHGDTAITASEAGLPTSSVHLYEPFGQSSSSTTFSTNSNPTNATDQPLAWAANPTRKVEGMFTLPLIQMGARIYLPTTGRFLQVDPIEGGTANSYVYPGDPVNTQDYSGQCVGPLAVICAAVAYTAARATVNYVVSKIVVSQIARQSARVVVNKGAGTTASKVSVALPKVTRPYVRPVNATTPAQRLSVQNQSCVTCGQSAPKMYADHKLPLVQEYYATGGINLQKMRTLDAVQSQCPGCSNIQGGQLSAYSRAMRDWYELQ